MSPLTKEQLRVSYREKRTHLDSASRQQHSLAIAEAVLESSLWKRATSVLIYVAAGSEVETRALLNESLAQKKRLVVPVRTATVGQLELSELKSMDHLAAGSWRGIEEPAAPFRELVLPPMIDLVIIPGLVFDFEGGRIGRGGGYYDRLLPLMPQARRVGLCFSIQVSPTLLPLEPFDQRMHAIVTESRFLEIAKPSGST